MGIEPRRFDHVPHDVACVVLCVVLRHFCLSVSHSFSLKATHNCNTEFPHTYLWNLCASILDKKLYYLLYHIPIGRKAMWLHMHGLSFTLKSWAEFLPFMSTNYAWPLPQATLTTCCSWNMCCLWAACHWCFVAVQTRIKLPCRQEELDIQPEWIFINGMVHLHQEWNFGTPESFPSPTTYTTLSPRSGTRRDFYTYMASHAQYTKCKIIAMLPHFGIIIWTHRASIKHALLVTIDKLMSGSSLRVKLF